MQNIQKVIEYISEEFFGDKEGNEKEDVKIRYLAEREDNPYWFIHTGDVIIEFKHYLALNTTVEHLGFKMEIGPDGFYLIPKKPKV